MLQKIGHLIEKLAHAQRVISFKEQHLWLWLWPGMKSCTAKMSYEMEMRFGQISAKSEVAIKLVTNSVNKNFHLLWQGHNFHLGMQFFESSAGCIFL